MTTRLLLLPRRGLRLRLQRLRIESDIEDVGIAGRSRRYRIHQIFGHQTERHAAALLHRHGGPVDLGGDRLLLHAGLHHRDTYRNLDGRRISRWASNDAALNTDSRGDLAAVQVTIARGAGDGRLITQIVADGLLAGRRYRIGGRAGANAHRGAGQFIVHRRWRRLTDGLRFRAEQLAEPVADRWAGVGRGAEHATTAAAGQDARNDKRQRNARTARPTGAHRPHHQRVTHHPDVLDLPTHSAPLKGTRVRAL